MAKAESFYETFQKANYSGMKVIGAGLPRTGTTTTRHALGVLLDGKCHHMKDFMMKGDAKEFDFWQRAMNGTATKEGWVEMMEGRGYVACVDYPASLFYKEAMEAFPDAKIVLTTRNPATWRKSVLSTIYQMQEADFLIQLLFRLVGKWQVESLVGRMLGPVFAAVEHGDAASAKFMEEWIEQVRRTVPKERLLIYEVKQGWKPLCDFLDVPEPANIPFPHSNDTATMKFYQKMMWIVSRTIFVGLPVLAAVGVGAFKYQDCIYDAISKFF